jgi:AcrR family transcriptional regulator
LQDTTTRAAPKKYSFKQEQLRLREQALIEAAAHLFASKGYDGATIDDVIGAVGISKPTFYSHFVGKEALAIKVIVSRLEKAISHLEEFATSMPPGQAARAMIDWAIDNQAGPDCEPTFAGALGFFDHEEVVNAEMRLTERLADLINMGQEDGTIKKLVNSRILSMTFRSILKDNSFFGKANDQQHIDNLKTELKSLLLS